MARRAKIVANEKKKKMAQKYFARRKVLREKATNPKVSRDERYQAQVQLQRLPRNSCSIRVRNRCLLTGRPRGNYRAFQLSRLAFRKLALQGIIPGITKSSW